MFFILTMSDIENSDIKVSDSEYVKTLYEKYGKTMWKYAFKLTLNSEIANDIVSATFLKIIEKIEIIRKIHVYKLKSYLFTMVKNIYINYVNREKANIGFENISDYISYTSYNDFTEEIGLSKVEDILKHLPEPYKSILLYRYVYDEMTYEEIAEITNISAKSIRMYKKRALDMLRDRLEGGEINREHK